MAKSYHDIRTPTRTTRYIRMRGGSTLEIETSLRDVNGAIVSDDWTSYRDDVDEFAIAVMDGYDATLRNVNGRTIATHQNGIIQVIRDGYGHVIPFKTAWAMSRMSNTIPTFEFIRVRNDKTDIQDANAECGYRAFYTVYNRGAVKSVVRFFYINVENPNH